MLTIKNIAIKTKNQAEKLAALYFLASKIGCKIPEIVLNQTINGICVGSHPIVYFNTSHVDAIGCIGQDYHLIEFSELANIDKILEQKNKPKIMVGKRYYYGQTKTFVVPIFIEGLDKYVLGGCRNNDFNLYDNGRPRTEAEMVKHLENYKLADVG